MLLQVGFTKLNALIYQLHEKSSSVPPPTLRLWPGYSAFHMPGTGKSGAPRKRPDNGHGKPWENTFGTCWNHESLIGSLKSDRGTLKKCAKLVYDYFCLRFLVMKQARLLDRVTWGNMG